MNVINKNVLHPEFFSWTYCLFTLMIFELKTHTHTSHSNHVCTWRKESSLYSPPQRNVFQSLALMNKGCPLLSFRKCTAQRTKTRCSQYVLWKNEHTGLRAQAKVQCVCQVQGIWAWPLRSAKVHNHRYTVENEANFSVSHDFLSLTDFTLFLHCNDMKEPPPGVLEYGVQKTFGFIIHSYFTVLFFDLR